MLFLGEASAKVIAKSSAVFREKVFESKRGWHFLKQNAAGLR
jgi:hypothetical protein